MSTVLGCSRVGFGTAGIMRLPTARGRRNLMAAAVDSGITHFDTARLYGLGQAEGELGAFIQGRRSQVTIATKFGIESTARLGSLARFQGPARRVLERFPAVRRAVKGRSESFYEPRRYDARTARASLEMSLRQLRTDYVDLFLVHDPTPQDHIEADELLEFLHEQRGAGAIRAWGVSQDAHPGFDVIGGLGRDAIMQIRDDVIIRDGRDNVGGSFTFGVLGRAHAQIGAALRADRQRHGRWQAALGADPLVEGRLAELLLADAFAANPDGTVIYSTLKPARLARAAGLEQTPVDRTVVTLRDLVAEDRRVLQGSAA